jgi:hypothetical protein
MGAMRGSVLPKHARVAFHMKYTIPLKATAIHHLRYMVLWILSMIPKSIPKWKVA